MFSTAFLSAGLRSEIAAHLAAAYPHEGCGILVGHGLDCNEVRIVRVVPTANVSLERTGDRYVIDPKAYGALDRELAQQKGLSIVGFFHSHPDGLPRPSSVDLEDAQGVFAFAQVRYLYLIYTVRRGTPETLTAWRLDTAGQAFEAVRLQE